jgi:prepilin signal peptidase PulO-like enzyme (type II secretory pathway)
LLLIWAALGLVVGVCLDLLIRWLVMRREDTRGLHCSVCETPRLDRRLLPIFGPFLVDSCPSCGRRRWRVPIAIHMSTAAAFAALAWRLPLDVSLVIFSLYAGILLIVFVTDLQHRLILNAVTYPAMLVAAVLAALLFDPGLAGGVWRALLGALFAGGLFFLLYVLAVILYRRDDALCLGDVKLAALIGLMTGWPGAMAAILLGTFLGALIGLGVMVRARSGRATMPYGTALTLGALLSILWHPPS